MSSESIGYQPLLSYSQIFDDIASCYLKSNRTGNETRFAIYDCKNGTYISDIIEGNSKSVETGDVSFVKSNGLNCISFDFHTHPQGVAALSLEDFRMLLPTGPGRRLNLGVGAIRNDELTIFLLKNPNRGRLRSILDYLLITIEEKEAQKSLTRSIYEVKVKNAYQKLGYQVDLLNLPIEQLISRRLPKIHRFYPYLPLIGTSK